MADVIIKRRAGATIVFVFMLLLFLICILGAFTIIMSSLSKGAFVNVALGIAGLVFFTCACAYSLVSITKNRIKLSGDELAISITAEPKEKSSLEYLKEILVPKPISRKLKVSDIEGVSLGHQWVKGEYSANIPYFKFAEKGGFEIRVNVLVFAESGWRELLTELAKSGVKMQVPERYFDRSRMEKSMELIKSG